MTTKNFLSIALAALAMLAVSTATMTLTACGDDDDDDSKTVSIYKQWEMVTPPHPAFASYVFDLSEQGKMKHLVKYAAEVAADMNLSADKYYIEEEGPCTITLNSDGKSGTIQLADDAPTMTFTDLTATTATIDGRSCKALAKKVVGEPMPVLK